MKPYRTGYNSSTARTFSCVCITGHGDFISGITLQTTNYIFEREPVCSDEYGLSLWHKGSSTRGKHCVPQLEALKYPVVLFFRNIVPPHCYTVCCNELLHTNVGWSNFWCCKQIFPSIKMHENLYCLQMKILSNYACNGYINSLKQCYIHL